MTGYVITGWLNYFSQHMLSSLVNRREIRTLIPTGDKNSDAPQELV
jgi:hypothetical protein